MKDQKRRKILAITTQLKQLRKESPKQFSGLNGIRTHDIRETVQLVLLLPTDISSSNLILSYPILALMVYL